MSLVFVEPNLKNNMGHVYEATRALYSYLESSDYEWKILGNVQMTDYIKREFPKIKPVIENTCFSTDDADSVVENYIKVIKSLSLSSDDFLIIMTSHLNELEAVSVISKDVNYPTVIATIHQFYPPLPNSDSIYNIYVNLELENSFRSVFSRINWNKVRIATTKVPSFRKKMESFANRSLELSPVPFEQRNISEKKSIDKLKVGWFGDGRKEKGLLKSLRLIKSEIDQLNDFEFIVHIQNPRGFSRFELEELSSLRGILSKFNNVRFIDGSLESSTYHEIFESCDCIFLPYDSDHYKIRLSGIAIEAGMAGIPIIASSGTSFADMINNGELAGVIFDDENDSVSFLSSLSLAKMNRSNLRKRSINLSSVIKDYYSAEYFVEKFILKK